MDDSHPFPLLGKIMFMKLSPSRSALCLLGWTQKTPKTDNSSLSPKKPKVQVRSLNLNTTRHNHHVTPPTLISSTCQINCKQVSTIPTATPQIQFLTFGRKRTKATLSAQRIQAFLSDAGPNTAMTDRHLETVEEHRSRMAKEIRTFEKAYNEAGMKT